MANSPLRNGIAKPRIPDTKITAGEEQENMKWGKNDRMAYSKKEKKKGIINLG